MHMTAQPAENAQEKPLWEPSQDFIENSLLFDFMQKVNAKTGQNFSDYQSLFQWSIENSAEFWDMLWDYCGVIGDKGDTVLANEEDIIRAVFYPNGRINLAENMLQKRSDETAIIFRNENKQERSLSFNEFYDEVSKWQQAFIKAGIQEGDRIAGYLPNMPETIITMLAAASLGAIWSSASPDFGAQGVIDRFGQIGPKIMITVDSYYYNGKTIDCVPKLEEICQTIESLEQVVVLPFTDQKPDLGSIRNAVSVDDYLSKFSPQEITFKRVDFNHPLFIMFSSGTTGVPKCIVHGHGGTLLQHLKEHRLQSDIKDGDRVFYFTTCGWMMWNWLVTAIGSGATLLLFDGSPFYPDGNVLWDFTADHKCTYFGTSAKYIDALKTHGLSPKDTHDLSHMRTIGSTGSPLVHESFDYVYGHIKDDTHLASIYGGTDIISASFGNGNPISPVYRGQIQGPALATAVEIFDENGKRIMGQAGELVCTRPFPSRPVGFWNDPDGKRYHGAYFETYQNVWHHSDWVEETPQSGLIVHGRSDATLNPGGVRIGTAEIYRQVEQVEDVVESICVGQDWDGDVRVVLFVVLKDGVTLDEALIKDIKTRIRTGASPRHMPAKVIAISDIPRTKSGKITEIAVRDVIMGRPIKNMEALANPEALDLYKDLDELKS